ncbi:MAG: hypothetical protein FH751_10335 [Firmicutes bacterium]|nr:hypothetical protein [Bacillota bacterium]
MKRNINITLIISIIGSIFSFYLIFNELITRNFCPEIFNIPACYIAFIAFSLTLTSQIIYSVKFSNILFFIGSITGLILGIWFSYNELIDFYICPRIFNIPLCYLSFLSFLLMLFINRVGGR